MTQDKADNDTDIGAQAIYEAVQKIVSDETRALLDADPGAAKQEADMANRIEAALNRLTGGMQTPPTLLEALILEALEPVLREWADHHLAAMAERLLADEIKAYIAAQSEVDAPPMWQQIKP